jgi:dipeptidyl aminopeptidase/acylaminoacyl peptidase
VKSVARNIALVICLAAALAAQQQRILTPGDNLVAEGIPPVPAALAEAAGRYTEFRSASFQSWHPTRREMLIGTRFADTNQIHHVRLPSGARTQLTFFTDRVGGARFAPAGAGGHFVFAKDVGGGEWFQNYRFDFQSGEVTLLTDGKSRNSLGAWSNRGDRMAYTSTRRTNRANDIYIVNPAEPASDRMLLEMETSGWAPLDWSPDDQRLLVAEYISINESYLWVADVAAGTKTLITPKGGKEKVAYSGARFSPHGKGLYVTTDLESEFQRLAYLDLETKQHRFLTSHIQWDVEDFEISRDGRTIALVTNEDGVSVLRLLDIGSGREQAVRGAPRGVIGRIGWHPARRELAFSVSYAQATSDVYSLDADGKIERWTYSESGGLDTSQFSEPELIHWKSFDGRSISGFLYTPPQRFTGKRPVIVNIHGGPEAQARPNYLGRNNYYIQELGVAMIYPNVRGSSGYGKTFLTLDNGFLREDSYKDINALFDWIATRPDLDAERVMVMGGSYGGFMVLAVATNYPERICCAVNVVGISNLVTFLQNTEAYRRDLRRAEYGDERDPAMRAFLERIAPLNNAHKISKPLFVIQGANDPRVPLSESEQMVATVRKHGTPVWYLMARDEGHGFAKKQNADFQFYATILFVQEHLLRGKERAAQD